MQCCTSPSHPVYDGGYPSTCLLLQQDQAHVCFATLQLHTPCFKGIWPCKRCAYAKCCWNVAAKEWYNGRTHRSVTPVRPLHRPWLTVDSLAQHHSSVGTTALANRHSIRTIGIGHTFTTTTCKPQAAVAARHSWAQPRGKQHARHTCYRQLIFLYHSSLCTLPSPYPTCLLRTGQKRNASQAKRIQMELRLIRPTTLINQLICCCYSGSATWLAAWHAAITASLLLRSTRSSMRRRRRLTAAAAASTSAAPYWLAKCACSHAAASSSKSSSTSSPEQPGALLLLDAAEGHLAPKLPAAASRCAVAAVGVVKLLLPRRMPESCVASSGASGGVARQRATLLALSARPGAFASNMAGSMPL